MRQEDWEESLSALGQFDVVLDSSGASWPALVKSVSPGGTLVSIGRTVRNLAEVVVRDLFVGQRRIVGSSMGSQREFAALLEHVSGAEWVPVVDSVFEMSQPAAAFARIGGSDRNGKVVLRV